MIYDSNHDNGIQTTKDHGVICLFAFAAKLF
jgi:hypothetical protein